jgi:hypothetical protein
MTTLDNEIVIEVVREEEITIPITFAIFSKSDNLNKEIDNALSFINENIPNSVSFTPNVVHLNEATEFTYEGIGTNKCCMLVPENVQDMGYEDDLPRFCIGYYLLWKLLEGDKNCYGGMAFWPPQGLNRRSTATSAYNTWYWEDTSDWHSSLTTGEAIIIHEIHHMLAHTLDDTSYYHQAFNKKDHQYTITIPFIDAMSRFGFASDYKWTQWCYQQLTYDMCKKLSEISTTDPDIPPEPPEPPEDCSLLFTTPGYDLIIWGEEHKTPVELSIPLTSTETEHGPLYEAKANIIFKSPRGECHTTISPFRLLQGEWALDETTVSDCFFDILRRYNGTASKLIISLKDLDMTVTKEELEKQLSGLDLKNIDWKALTSCTPNWYLSVMPLSGIGTIVVIYEELPIRVDVSYKRPNVSIKITDDWAPIRVIDKSLADKIVTDIASTPHNLSFTTDDFDDTEGLMLYSNAIVEWEKAIAAFPSYYHEFIERLEAGYDFDKCVCQLNYKVLRPFTHWIETPTFIDPTVNWFYDETEEIYKSIPNCRTQECVKEHLDLFYSKMLQLYNQFPTINSPYFTITSEHPISAEVQEFDGSWHTVGVDFKSLEVKINEEGATNVRFYDIQVPPDFMGLPRQPPTTVQHDVIEARYNGSDYTFDPLFTFIYPCPFIAFIKDYTTEYNIELYGLDKEVDTLITGPGVETSDTTTYFSSVTVKPLDVGRIHTEIRIVEDPNKYLTFTQPIYNESILHLEASVANFTISGQATIDVATYEPSFSLTFWDGTEFDESTIDTDPPNIGLNYGWNSYLGEIGLPLLKWEQLSDENGKFSVELPYVPQKIITVVTPPGFDYDKPFVITSERREINGTISISESTITTTLYQQTPSAFDMQVINTGTVSAQYQVAITFEGIDVANEEVFWSDWSVEVASNESTTLPVLVELSERAIPEEAETAEYNIITKLVAR